jgi:hypothetical protein
VRVSVITLTTGDRHDVEGTTSEVEATILAAARGSIMQLAWLTDAITGEQVGVNPEHVVCLRAALPDEPGSSGS